MNYGEHLEAELEKHGGRIPTDFSGANPPVESFEDNPISQYSDKTGNLYLAEKLNMSHYFKADPLLETKVQEIETYFLNRINELGMRDSALSYDALLQRMTESLGTPLEEIVRSGNSRKLVDILFSQVALENKKSSESYIKDAKSHQVDARIVKLINSLKDLVVTLKH